MPEAEENAHGSLVYSTHMSGQVNSHLAKILGVFFTLYPGSNSDLSKIQM